MPKGTLFTYLRGRDMKAEALVRLAEATGVNIVWLATGDGPMQGSLPEAPVHGGELRDTPPAAPVRLFGTVKIDRLEQAYDGAMAASGGDKRLLLHLIVVLYDQLTEAADAAEKAETERVRSPQE